MKERSLHAFFVTAILFVDLEEARPQEEERKICDHLFVFLGCGSGEIKEAENEASSPPSIWYSHMLDLKLLFFFFFCLF